MSDNKLQIVIIVLMAIFVIGICIYADKFIDECTSINGTVVRGIFLFKCIKSLP